MNTARAISKAAGHMSGGTNNRELLAGNSASSRIKSTVDMIDATYTVTVTPGVMEFTCSASPILPVAVVRGEYKDGEWFLLGEAGPGFDLSDESIRAFEIVAMRRLLANAAKRTEGGQA